MQLLELKKTYDACRLSKESYKLLLKQREEIHERIEHLNVDAESAVYKTKKTPSNLNELKASLKEIDHQLDELGESHDEELIALREKLVAEIQHTFPESKVAYQQFSITMQTEKDKERSFTAQIEHLRSFHSALNEGAASKQSRGFLGILFGRNAQVMLARAIRKASIEAERVSKQIEDEQIKHFLETFLNEANRPWNSALYKERFYELHQEFCKIMDQLETKQAHTRRNILKTAQEIEVWIEHYCRESEQTQT